MASNRYAPRGYQNVTPYFTVADADKQIEFLEGVFGAEVLNRSEREDGTVGHAEVKIGESVVELSAGSDRFPPRANTLHVFVPDTDDCYARALAAGAASLYEPADMPYGERSAGVEDPQGNHWYIATFTGGDRGYYG
ncbi:VOC family protein [Cohnella sp.]|uniref:VOC family protein n=1 Tax=Cohnella sp. TaxID=1883426 RepID=UPI003567757B